MYDFCPLCSKRGFKRKIKALQINFHEAVWACEGDECEWPFGYEDFVFVSREVGSTWSCYWNDFKPPLQKVNECVPVSTELSLYTPPETPAEVVQCSDNNATTNDINNSITVNEIQSMNAIHISDHNAYCLTNATAENTDSKHKNESTLVSDKPSIEDAQGISNTDGILKNEVIEDLNFGGTILIAENNRENDVEANASEVQSIEKNKDLSDIDNIDKAQDDTKTSDLILNSKGQDSTPAKSNNTSPSLKITTVSIDGLPPVILSYEAPTASFVPTTVCDKSTNPNTGSSITRSNATHKLISLISKQPSGPNVAVSKQYAKFSFNAIKKKANIANDNTSVSLDNECLAVSNKSGSNIKNTDKNQRPDTSKTVTSYSSTDTNISAKKEVVKIETPVSENATADSNLNLDTFLDDFMKDEITESYTISDIDEDWINSLLH